MAEKISVQIALEGGKEVERQLADIGDAGQKAFDQIEQAASQVGGFKNLDPGVATAKLKEFGVTGVQEIGKIQKALQTAVRFETLVTGVQSVEAAFMALGRAAGPVGAAIAAGLAAAAKATIAFAAEINKASDQAVKLGLSLEGFKKFQQDFAKLGVSGQAAADGFAKFQQNLEKAAQADPGGQLAAFGLSADAVRQQMAQFREQLRQMPDGFQRTKLAISEMDAAGLQLVQGLRRAEGSMSETEAKAYDLGQALQRLKTAWDQLGSVTLAPAMTAGLDAITAAINQANQSFLSFAGTIAAGFANPFELLAQQATKFGLSLLGIGPAGQQAGQQAAQGLQLVANPLTGMPELVNTTNQALAQTGQAGAQAGQQAAGGLQLVTNALTGMPELIRQVQPPDASSWTSWASTVVSAIGSAISKLLEWIGLKDRAGTGTRTGGEGTAVPGVARGGLIGGRGTGTSDSNLAWLSRGEYVVRAASVRQFGAAFFAALNAGRIPGFAAGGMANGGAVGAGGDIVQTINQTAQQTAKIDANVNTVINMLNDIGGGMISLAEGLARLIQTVGRVDDNVIGLSKLIGQLIQDVSKKAGGGLIGGRGSGTSDSNLAWLSRGEFVITAAAVRRFGAGFFAALNAGMIPGFALGGLVPRPAFAGGGSVGGSNHVTIQFPGVPPVSGLRASSAVVEQLQKAAALAQVRSGGRKPSRYS